MNITDNKKSGFYPNDDRHLTKEISDGSRSILGEVLQRADKFLETSKAISCTDYHSAKEIIISMKSWLAEGEGCFDKFSTEQKADLLNEIVQVKTTLHLVEQWIIWAIAHHNRSSSPPRI